jgi:hypothetical protein
MKVNPINQTTVMEQFLIRLNRTNFLYKCLNQTSHKEKKNFAVLGLRTRGEQCPLSIHGSTKTYKVLENQIS